MTIEKGLTMVYGALAKPPLDRPALTPNAALIETIYAAIQTGRTPQLSLSDWARVCTALKECDHAV